MTERACAGCRSDLSGPCWKLTTFTVNLEFCGRHCLHAWLAAHPDGSQEEGPE